MRKIISLFQRNYDGDRLVRNEVTPGAEWVIAGEGVATRKLDGTCCLIRDGKLYKRYEVKAGGTPPANFEPANEVDEVTGKQQGWIPVSFISPEDRWHREGLANTSVMRQGTIPDGTYELLGPRVQGNPEKAEVHYLERHGEEVLHGVPRDFEGLREYLSHHNIEGVVWHHQDGRMVKIKAKDFGIRRGGNRSC